MKIQLINEDNFRLEGNINDTFQLLFEALEIAAASGDQYAPEFAALSDSLMLQSADWSFGPLPEHLC